jgi:HEAT repeat protein/lysophospholipase L1-like esterase
LASAARALLANLALSGATVLVAGLVLEGGARILDRLSPPPRRAPYLWDWEQEWRGEFYTLRPSGAGWPPGPVNRDGVRDRPHPVEKLAGLRRLVFLGDSVTLGYGIEPEQAFPQRVGERFEAAGLEAEAFNLALMGWTTRQQRIAYRRIARRYGPDAVVLGVCLNDVPELQNNLTAPPRWLATLYRRSAFVRRATRAEAREIRSVEELFDDPPRPSVRQGFALFFDELRALRDELRADGVTLSILVFPFRFQVAPGAPPPRAQARILEFCRAEGLRCLDLLPALAPLGEAAFHDYDHLSAEGAQATADAVLAWRPLDDLRGASETLGARVDLPVLRRLVAAGSPDERVAAAWALRRIGSPAAEALEELTAALDDSAPRMRAAAARALGALRAEGRPALPRLAALLSDPSEPVRWHAAIALHRIGPTAEAVPALAPALASPDPYVCGFAAWTLGNLGAASAAAVPELVAALERRAGAFRLPEVDQRWLAARALGRIGPPAKHAVAALAAALPDADRRLRAQAALALGRIGPGAAPARSALERATHDPDAEVRFHAEQALKALGAEPSRRTAFPSPYVGRDRVGGR